MTDEEIKELKELESYPILSDYQQYKYGILLNKVFSECNERLENKYRTHILDIYEELKEIYERG